MHRRIGVILLDGAEVIVGIYSLDRDLKWQKIYSQVSDLRIDYLEIIETLADILLFGLKLQIKNWKVLSRNLSDEILKQISQTTKLKIKNLDLKTEQELICKGVLNET